MDLASEPRNLPAAQQFPTPDVLPRRRPSFWRRFQRSPAGLLGLLLIVGFVLTAAFAPRLAPYEPSGLVAQPFAGPSRAHPFGTDNLGRDVFSGVVFGARVSLAVGVIATATSFTIGILVGSIAGYQRGRLDAVLMRLTEMFQVMPRFFLGLLLVAVTGPGLWKIILVIGILSWPALARLVRAQFLALREREFVEAARAMGFPTGVIIFREILPNALPPCIVVGSLDVAQAILLEASLSFFGLGDPNLISWGMMLNGAQAFLRTAWWVPLFPGLCIFLAVLGFNLFGDGLNDALNPRLRSRIRL